MEGGGRGRGGAEGLRERGWKHSQKSCPVVGIGMGGTSLLAPPRPGLGAAPQPPHPRDGRTQGLGGAPSPSSRRVPASQAAVPPVPGRERRRKGLGAGKGDPEPAVRGRSGLQLVPLCHSLPRAGDHVLPVLHLAGTALPGQVNLRETHPWSHRGLSIPTRPAARR